MPRITKIFTSGSIAVGICLFFSCLRPTFSPPTPTVYIINGPQDLYPAFSNDGNYIAYSHQGDTTKNYPPGLYVIDRNGVQHLFGVVVVGMAEHHFARWKKPGTDHVLKRLIWGS